MHTVGHTVGAILATAVVAYLVCGQPVVGRRRYARLVAAVATDPEARARHYRRAMVGEWSAVAVIALIGALTGRTPASIGLRSPHRFSSAALEVGEVTALLAATTVLFRVGGAG